MNKGDRWKTFCEKWIRRVDPTFAEPVYLLSARQAKGIVDLSGAWGLTALGMCGDLRGLLERRGEWRGPGFAAVVALDRIKSTSVLISVVLHELCHHALSLATTTTLAEMMGKAAYDGVLARPRALVRGESAIIKPTPTPRPWTGHDGDFIRLAIHVEWRAWRAGRRAVLGDWPSYGLPSGWLWRKVLGDEVFRLADWPLVEIAKLPAPIAYQEFSRESETVK